MTTSWLTNHWVTQGQVSGDLIEGLLAKFPELRCLYWNGPMDMYDYMFTLPDTFLETGDLILFPSAASSSQLRLKLRRTCERASALVGQTRWRWPPPEQFLEPRLTQCCRKRWLSPALSSSDSSLVSQCQVSAKPRFQMTIVRFWSSRLISFPAQEAVVELMKEQQ